MISLKRGIVIAACASVVALSEASPALAEPTDRWLLMDLLLPTSLGHSLESAGTQVYGWIQQGFAGNIQSPRDHVNFGTNYGWRSNDYRLDQAYFVIENTLEHDGRFNIGYRVDFLVGHDAPFFVANGMFSSFTGFDPGSGVGSNGPKSFREVNRVGIDLPQFFLEVHLPRLLSTGGVDIKAGKFYTLMGREVYPGADTDFYSRTYENVYATPFTHTGVMTTLHATPTLDVVVGVVRGWDVFRDNNDMVTFHGGFLWNSPDKRYNWTTAWITGPEQPDNDRDYRSLISSYLYCQAGLDGRMASVRRWAPRLRVERCPGPRHRSPKRCDMVRDHRQPLLHRRSPMEVGDARRMVPR